MRLLRLNRPLILLLFPFPNPIPVPTPIHPRTAIRINIVMTLLILPHHSPTRLSRCCRCRVLRLRARTTTTTRAQILNLKLALLILPVRRPMLLDLQVRGLLLGERLVLVVPAEVAHLLAKRVFLGADWFRGREVVGRRGVVVVVVVVGVVGPEAEVPLVLAADLGLRFLRRVEVVEVPVGGVVGGGLGAGSKLGRVA